MSNHPDDIRPFHFKQFSLYHHKSSMKVGTDAILLGVWADVNSSETVLDIGSGCGIISLLIACRSNAIVDAVEIDFASFEESTENFKNSDFSDRLSVAQTNFIDYVKTCKREYDLIISNPPFFSNNNFKPKDSQRKDARHTDALSFEKLCDGVSKILKAEGKFCVVIPRNERIKFLEVASLFNLHLQKQLSIHPKRNQAANRFNLQLGFDTPSEVQKENIYIRENDLTFTLQFVSLLKKYYIGWD